MFLYLQWNTQDLGPVNFGQDSLETVKLTVPVKFWFFDPICSIYSSIGRRLEVSLYVPYILSLKTAFDIQWNTTIHSKVPTVLLINDNIKVNVQIQYLLNWYLL